MDRAEEITIVGAGLAGCCAALALARTHRVTLVDDGRPGASHAAAGLINPFMGRKASPAWRWREALAALHRLDEAAGSVIRWAGLLRPAADRAQAALFRDRAADHPEALDWLEPHAAARDHPGLVAPHGALGVREGGSVDLPALLVAIRAEATRRGVVTAREPADLAITDQPALLCVGDALAASAPALPLHRIKGQTVRLRPSVPLALPPIAAGTYVVPQADGTVLVGATFEHAFSHLDPTPEASHSLRERAARLVPALADAEIVEARAGVRLTVPAAARPGRLPLVGPAPGREGVWVFGALGAKGLLTAPLLAEHLPAWLRDPGAIWPEVSTHGLGAG